MLSKIEIKYIQSLAHKKSRDSEVAFLVEGKKMIQEVLTEFPHQIIRLYGTADFYEEANLQTDAVKYLLINETELKRISQLQTPNAALAIIKKMPVGKIDNNQWLLALDAIRDPGNLGTIIRIADWFGIQQILCSTDCADVYNPKTVQASMGSIMRVHIMEGVLKELLPQCPRPVYAATLSGTAIQKISFNQTGTLLIGNEARGVANDLLKFVNTEVAIPSFGNAESLNAAVATGILLWEIKR